MKTKTPPTTKLPTSRARANGLPDPFEPPQSGQFTIGIKLLREDPDNERKVFEDMEGMIASIRRAGIVEPLAVAAQKDGTYKILRGHRRYRAAKAIGLDQIPVLIEVEGRNHRRNSLISNVARRDLGPIDLADALQERLEEDPDITSQKDLAEFMGENEPWVSARMANLKIPKALRERLRTPQLGKCFDQVERIARLVGDVPEREIETLVNRLLAEKTPSSREFRGVIAEVKGGKDSSAADPEGGRLGPPYAEAKVKDHWRIARRGDQWQVKEAPGWRVAYRTDSLLDCADWLAARGVERAEVAVTSAGSWKSLAEHLGQSPPAAKARACRVCGCTHTTPRMDQYGNTCAWAEEDLCTACADKRGMSESEDAAAKERRAKIKAAIKAERSAKAKAARQNPPRLPEAITYPTARKTRVKVESDTLEKLSHARTMAALRDALKQESR